MPDISYKKFSDLAAANTLIAADVIPVVTTTGGNNSKKITYETFAQTVSSTLIGPFTTTITAVVPASADKWNSTYTTVQSNSATWGAGSSTDGLTIFTQISSVVSPNVDTTVHALSIISSKADVDITILSKGTGATLAQIPDDSNTGGSKRGQYATDFQKARTINVQVASGNYSVIGGGQNNTAGTGTHVTVGGGYENIASGNYATVAGGIANRTTSGGSFVGGGQANTASSTAAAIGGGFSNRAAGQYTTIGGGYSVSAVGDYSTVVGGYLNRADGRNSFIAGGSGNNTAFSNTFIVGSNITAPLSNYTYVNNISSQGTITSSTATISSLSAIGGTIDRPYFKTKYVTYSGTASAIIVDFGIASRWFFEIFGGSGALDLIFKGLTDGSEMIFYLRNRHTATRTITTNYGDEFGYTSFTFASSPTSVGQAGINSFTLAANPGMAAIVVTNVGGQIVGSAA